MTQAKVKKRGWDENGKDPWLLMTLLGLQQSWWGLSRPHQQETALIQSNSLIFFSRGIEDHLSCLGKKEQECEASGLD